MEFITESVGGVAMMEGRKKCSQHLAGFEPASLFCEKYCLNHLAN